MQLLTLFFIEFPILLVVCCAVLLEALRRGIVSASGRTSNDRARAWFLSALIILVPVLIMVVVQVALTPGYGTWIFD